MKRTELGRAGEDEAVRFLEDHGWTILGRNVRSGRREVDIVAIRGWLLTFVEVKTRRGRGHGHPLDAITRRKQREIERVARSWIRSRPPPPGTQLRFDAISVFWPQKGLPEVLHVPDAWRIDPLQNP